MVSSLYGAALLHDKRLIPSFFLAVIVPAGTKASAISTFVLRLRNTHIPQPAFLTLRRHTAEHYHALQFDRGKNHDPCNDVQYRMWLQLTTSCPQSSV
jgi:hypothetical protein